MFLRESCASDRILIRARIGVNTSNVATAKTCRSLADVTIASLSRTASLDTSVTEKIVLPAAIPIQIPILRIPCFAQSRGGSR
jgi:hypothetical protein